MQRSFSVLKYWAVTGTVSEKDECSNGAYYLRYSSRTIQQKPGIMD